MDTFYAVYLLSTDTLICELGVFSPLLCIIIVRQHLEITLKIAN